MTLFEEYIQASRGLAFVATSKQNQPSIRIMGFAADPDQPNIWYFNSKPNTEKMIDLAANENVSVITPLNQNGARIESNHATMRRSDKKWADIKDLFANNKPYLHAHPDVENEVILVLEIHSARLASYAGTEIVNFD
ncbi:pyridoxamine 5'-phosphate oxidase family protein [Leuconostoc falkenbergense]|uniref:pyridoxamine 5'-phosphate oxidase family protein n=1 Tax=Leuconostoc falkenbergense TaxID=2766470 RepID=UPI0024A871E3|nr:pyridoxamine 5'-phosphate oxidase family protein [Leuconostoc falkenbergense]MDI6553148.1 pyridoxamine 5'-phosphate oxidase family protein [Leuconostoc falkenbergense]